MNTRSPARAAVSVLLGTALAVGATGCTRSDNAADSSAADAPTAATTPAAQPPATSGTDATTAGQSPGSTELHRIMEEGKSMPMSMSGDVDKDFASMMTMHHQHGIRMVDVLQQHGQSAELKALGAKIKAEQQEEIKTMAPHASASGTAAAGHEGMAGMNHAQGNGKGSAELHAIMEEGKAMPMTMSGNVDQDFATMMTMHHQQAVQMSDVQLTQGKHAELKALAQKMKAAQQQEIKQLAAYAK